MRIEASEQPGTTIVIRDTIAYTAPNVGNFPTLEAHIDHGFRWNKGAPNYSYVREPNYPNSSAINRVRERIRTFLEDVGLEFDDKIVVIQSPTEEEGILDIEPDFFDSQSATDQGTFIQGAAVFTTNKEASFIFPLGDCRWAIMHAPDKNGQDTMGIIHLSRKQLDNNIVGKALRHAESSLGIERKNIRVGITPGISKNYHRLQFNGLTNPAHWGGFLDSDYDGTLLVDTLGFAINQFQQEGINSVDAYSDNLCVYIEGLNNNFYASHRFAIEQGGINGRLITVAKLK